MDICSLLCEKFKPLSEIPSAINLQKPTYVYKSLPVLNHNGYVSVHFLKSLFLFLNQRTPLHVAASKGRDYTVECLVKKGADISIKDKAGVSGR